MKTLKIPALFLLLVIASSVLYFSNQNNDEAEISSSPLELADLKYPSEIKTKPSTSKTTHKIYKRQKMVQILQRHDLVWLRDHLSDPDKLLEKVIEIQERSLSIQSDLDYSAEKVWDLNKAPESQKEYSKLLREAHSHALGLISLGVKKKDLSLIRKSFSGIRAIEIFKALEFKGYDKGDHLILSFPDDFVAQNKKRRDRIVKRLSSVKKRKVANQEATIQEKEELSLEALFEEKMAQTAYNSDLETSSQAMDEYWGGEASFFASMTDTADYLVNTVTQDIFGMTPVGAQKKVEQVIGDTLEDARAHPGDYGLLGDLPRDVADLDFEIFAEAISRNVSLNYALLAAGLSTVLGEFAAHKLVSGVKIFAAGVIISLGAESLFGALGSYWGSSLLVLLHRYQTYIRDAKETILVQGDRGFDVNKIEPFNPELVFYSETTRIELNKSWLWGFGFGFATNKWVTLTLMNKIGRVFSVHLMSLAASNNMKLSRTGQIIRMLRIFANSSLERSAARLLRVPFAGQGFVSRLLRRFKRILAVTPAGIASMVGDFIITSLAIYTTIHIRLYGVTQMLDRVYHAPEMAIHLANNQAWHQSEPFLEASRQHFYRLCHFAATNDLNRQQMTPAANEGEGRINQVFARQIENCLQMIAAFEGVPAARIEDHLRRKVTDGSIDSEVVTLFYGNGRLNSRKITTDLVKMHKDYPEYYQVIWTTALKAVFAHGYVPDEFYSIKNLILTGQGGHLYENYNSYLEFSSHQSAKKINATRFEYIIERLAYRAQGLKVELGRAEEGDPLVLSEAFSVFWQHHSEEIRRYDEEILEFLMEEEEGFWASIWGGFRQAWGNLQFLVNRLLNPVYEGTYRYQVEKEIEGPGLTRRLYDRIRNQ